MLVSLDWINDYVNIPSELSSEDLMLRFTMGVAEVEEVLEVGKFWSELSVVEVTHIEAHPEADKLNLVSFKLSDSESFRVVCGASNVKLGMKTVFAPIGVTLPIGLTLSPRKIRGILSEGMLCSEEELALSESSAGILELPEDAPVGQSMDEYWEKNSDTLLDIDNKSLTHRPDLWGHYGMAREFATLFKNDLKNPFDEKWSEKIDSLIEKGQKSPMRIRVDENCAGKAYFGLSMNEVTIGESPDWMKDRLNAVGLRPINNIVDISNYVMLELGMPLHIFDRDKIAGDCVHIKALKESVTFKTLDEIDRNLIAGDTVISDQNGALVIAGIMGGMSSGVSDQTKNIFIEVANWHASSVRKTSTRLGLRTDSSMRYEKSLDSKLCKRTLFRVIELVKQLCPDAQVIGEIEYDGEDFHKDEPIHIKTSIQEICSTLGKDVSTSEIVRILKSLEFKVIKKEDILELEVPSWRATKDVECAADIIEEIGRIIGYDNITPDSPLLDVRPVRLNTLMKLKRSAQDYFSLHASALEVNTYPMIGKKLLEKSSWPSDMGELSLINSLSIDNDRMRQSVIPSFLEVCALNVKSFDRFRFFELARQYYPDDKNFSNEANILAVAFFEREHSPFVKLLDNIEGFCAFSNIPFDYTDRNPKFKSNVVDEDWVGMHPFETKNMRIMGKMDGHVFSVHPMILKKFKIKGHLSIAVIDLSAASSRGLKDKGNYKPLPKFPGSRFDYTVTLSSAQSVEDIFTALKKLKVKEVYEHQIVDVFEPKGEGDKFVTMRSLIIDPEKTLSGDFIKECEQKIVNTLEKANISLKES